MPLRACTSRIFRCSSKPARPSFLVLFSFWRGLRRDPLAGSPPLLMLKSGPASARGGRGDVYFYNADTDASMVEHPLEAQYRQMYTEAKMGAGGRVGSAQDDFDPDEAVPISHQEVCSPTSSSLLLRSSSLLFAGGRSWWSQQAANLDRGLGLDPGPALWLDAELPFGGAALTAGWLERCLALPHPLTYFSQVDMRCPRYTSVNSPVPKRPGSPNRSTQID